MKYVFRGSKFFKAVALVSVMSASAAHAVGSAGGATITNVDARSNGLFLITLSQPISNSPSCVTVNNRMTGNATVPGGKAVLAAAMLAFSTGARIALAEGTGACSEYAGIESISILSQGQ
jgi:hypothetical protein